MSDLLISLLLPAVTYAVGIVVNIIRKAAGGAPWLMQILIPILGVGISALDSWLNVTGGTLTFAVKVVLTLVATFLHELISNLGGTKQ